MKGDTGAGASSPAEGAMRCPRCDSPNTKFCYYNNYSLSQPRHFCKTCRRYWTRGGALRNVPIGGGCRKSKKTKPNPALFSGLSPAMDFAAPGPSWLAPPHLGAAIQQIITNNNNPNNNNVGLASTIESLSCMNQDLHWKLQQQRLSLLFSKQHHDNNVNVPGGSSFNVAPVPHDLVQEPSTSEWFSGNSYANHQATPAAGNDINVGTVSSWNNGFQAWTDHNHHFSTA